MAGGFANVVQLVRAHYSHDEDAFATAAMTLARGAKDGTFRDGIDQLVRVGRASNQQRKIEEYRRKAGDGQTFRKLPEAPAQLANGMLRTLEGPSFADLLLPPDIQAIFDEIVTELEYSDELKARGLRPRDRILLHGPPGNGKTSSAVAIAKQLGVPCFGCNISEVFGKYLGDTSKNVQQLFESLPQNAISVLDEIDAIAGTRTAYGTQACDKELNASVNTLLTALDRSCHGIIVATTNRVEIIDPAVKRRFEEVIELPAPSCAQMQMLADRLCAGFGVRPVDVSLCDNYNAVAKSCRREARRVIMREILAADAAVEEDSNAKKEAGDWN